MARLGYFQTVSWFWLKPWPVMSSLYSVFHTMEETWLPVSTHCNWFMLLVFHILYTHMVTVLDVMVTFH